MLFSWLKRRRDPLQRPRRWVAHSPSGAIVLGEQLTYHEALRLAANLGTVSFTDAQHGFIFYNTHLLPRGDSDSAH